MKYSRLTILICFIISISTVLVFGNSSEGITLGTGDGIRGFGSYTRILPSNVQIPSYSLPGGSTVPSHSLPITTTYRVTYDLATGKISKATILRHDLVPSEVTWDNGRGQASSIAGNYGSTSISPDGYTVTLIFGVNVGVNFRFYAGGPVAASRSYNYSLTLTDTPDTP